MSKEIKEQTGYYDEATETYHCDCGWSGDSTALDALDGGGCPQCDNEVFKD